MPTVSLNIHLYLDLILVYHIKLIFYFNAYHNIIKNNYDLLIYE